MRNKKYTLNGIIANLKKLIVSIFKKEHKSCKKYPNEIKDVWYNHSIWSEKVKYPIVFDKNRKYIECSIGLKVIMFETFTKKVFYEVVDIRSSRGSDFYYQSDAYNCDLKFSHIETMNI